MAQTMMFIFACIIVVILLLGLVFLFFSVFNTNRKQSPEIEDQKRQDADIEP